MYKIQGADGKEYGPVSTDQLRQWMSEGRINAQTRVLPEGATEWKTVSETPELSSLLSATVAGAAVPLSPLGASPGPTPVRSQALAITSFVLGLLSLTCFFVVAGIPAIICGHIAHNRARRLPAVYGGAGFAIAGFVMGYVSLAFSILILPAMLFPALSKAKERAQSINCVNNMKQIGLAFKVWAIDHQEQFPFNVSTNQGGTMEISAVGYDAFDRNGFMHLRAMSNELASLRILVCPSDSSKRPALSFQTLQAVNVSYQLHSGTNFNDSNPQAVLAVCPIHGHSLLCDGSVQQSPRSRRHP